MARRLDLNLMAALEALIAERSVSGAARRLGLGQPSWSSALARLRALLDDPLLVRGARGMEPTPRAIEVPGPLRDALDALRAVARGRDAFDPAASERTFSLSRGDYVGMALLPGLLRRLRTEAPGVSLRFRFVEKGQVLACLDAGEVDLALAVMDEVPARFERRPVLLDDFVCLVAARPRLGRPGADAALLRAVEPRPRHRERRRARRPRRGARGPWPVAAHRRHHAVGGARAPRAGGHRPPRQGGPARGGARLREATLRTLPLPFEVPPTLPPISLRRDAKGPGLAWLRQALAGIGESVGGASGR